MFTMPPSSPAWPPEADSIRAPRPVDREASHGASMPARCT
jgi:hypothetical protein